MISSARTPGPARASVLLLDASGPAAAAIVGAAAFAGIAVHAVTTPRGWAAYRPELTGQLAGRLLTDLDCAEQALTDVADYARRHLVGGVLTVNEYLTPLAAQAATALGVPGHDPALSDTARNKAAMAARLADCGVAVPATQALRDHCELDGLLASGRIEVPLVTKPADGAGSAGVTVVTDPSQTRVAWDAARHAATASPRGRYGTPADLRVVVQDHVHGTEYSVESITQHGHTTHLCVTRKTTTGGPYPVEVGHSLPAVLPPATQRRVLTEADAAIRAVGIRNGASHTELILTGDGCPVVLEIGARMAAGYIGILIQHALGIDPWRALLDVALGRPAVLVPTRDRYAAVRFITAPAAGPLIAITGLPYGEPHVHDIRVRVAVGDHVEPAVSNGARLGSFIVTGTDPQCVDERADALAGRIHVAVDDKAAVQISADSTADISP